MNTVSENPYIGPRTFEENERDRFFGREREANELLALVLSEQLVLFYAESGAGKSSLVNTCLIPDLRKKGFEVFLGRVGGDAPSGVHVGNIYAFNLMRTLVTRDVDLTRLTDQSLSKFVAEIPMGVAAGQGHTSKRRILIVDQFEELFSTHPEAWQKREDFFDQLAQAMEEDPHLRVILVMREDYTASLDPYAHRMANRFRMRYYMQQLGYEAALKAVKKPVESREFYRPYATGVAEKLVDNLRSIKIMRPDGTPDKQLGQYVEPVQLQVICHNLWKKLPPGGSQITEKDLEVVGDINTSLGNYFADRVKSVADDSKVPERRIREWFVNRLISPGGLRNMVLQEPDGRSGGLESRVIRALPDLIRTEHRGGAVFYELTHDRMVEPIQANNKKWESEHLNLLQRGAILWNERGRSEDLLLRGRELISAENEARNLELTDLEKIYLHASRKLRDQENKVRIRNRLLAIITLGALVAMCIAFVFGVSSFYLMNQAQVFKDRADSNAAAAEASALDAKGQWLRYEGLRLALHAKNLLFSNANSNTELATLLSIRSLQIEYVSEADAALAESMNRPHTFYTFEGHTEGVRNIAVSPDGKYLATASIDNTARIWSIESGAVVYILEGHTSWVNSVAFSPDGQQILTGSADKTANIWDVSSGEVVRTLSGHEDAVLCATYSPDGSFVLTCSSDKTARLWDAKTGTEVRKFMRHENAVRDAAFSTSGSLLLTGSDDRTAKLWNVDTGNEMYTFKGFQGEVYSVDFSPDDTQVVFGIRGTSAEVWNIQSFEKRLTLAEHRSTINDVAFSNNGSYILTGSFDNTAMLWNAKTGERIRTFSGHSNWINGIAFSVDDQYVFTGSADATAKIWLTRGSLISRQINFEDEIETVLFSPDGQSILTAGYDSYVILWSTVTGKGLHVYQGLYNPVAISADGRHILASNSEGIAKLLDAETGEEIQTYDHIVWSTAISPDGSFVLTGGTNGTAKLWDLNSGVEIRSFEGHEEGINMVTFSPDGKHILTGSADNTAKLWDMQTGEEIFTLESSQSVWSVAFSPDGQYLLTGSLDNTARLWDRETGEEIRVFNGHSDRIFGAAFSSDGKYILTGSADNTARLWNTETGEQIRILEGHTNMIYSVAFSPDDKYLATAGADGAVRLWDFDYQTTMDLACSILTRDLTVTEREQYGIFDDNPTCPIQPTAIIPVTSLVKPTAAEIESVLYTGNILDTLILLDQARKLDSNYAKDFDAIFWNSLCWNGSLNGYFIEVKDYCEQAVQLSDDGRIRDSRGLNRALLGEYDAAVEDFEYAVEWLRENGEAEEIIRKREEWINFIRAGNDPFTHEVLEALKSE